MLAAWASRQESGVDAEGVRPKSAGPSDLPAGAACTAGRGRGALCIRYALA